MGIRPYRVSCLCVGRARISGRYPWHTGWRSPGRPHSTCLVDKKVQCRSRTAMTTHSVAKGGAPKQEATQETQGDGSSGVQYERSHEGGRDGARQADDWGDNPTIDVVGPCWKVYFYVTRNVFSNITMSLTTVYNTLIYLAK